MPIHSILVALYPSAYALPASSINEENGGEELAAAIRDSKNLKRALASPCPLMQEHVAKGPSPAYIIANGFNAWLLRTESGSSLEEKSAVAIGELAQKACDNLQQRLQPSMSPMALSELPAISETAEDTWQAKVRLATLFVEDEGATEMSYNDWVEFLQGHILHMVNH